MKFFFNIFLLASESQNTEYTISHLPILKRIFLYLIHIGFFLSIKQVQTIILQGLFNLKNVFFCEILCLCLPLGGRTPQKRTAISLTVCDAQRLSLLCFNLIVANIREPCTAPLSFLQNNNNVMFLNYKWRLKMQQLDLT